MKSFKTYINEAKDTHCSDKCCGADTKAEDCGCPPDCPHCNCNAKNEAVDCCKHCGCEVGNPKEGCDCSEDCHESVNEKAGTEFTPHWMYDPRTGNRVKAEKEVDHHRMKAMGYTHDPYKREDVEESFDPKHPKVVAARKAVKNGTYNGNVDKNGNAIVHIKGKPHTVTKGDPASQHESFNEDVIDIINENNITIEQLENMTEEELQELLRGTGKVIGGTAKVAYGLSRLAGRGVGKLAKTALINKQGNIRGTAAAKLDKAKAKQDRLQSTLDKIQNKRRANIKAKLADRASNRIKKDIVRQKAKLKQTQNRPKPSI